MTNAIRGWRSFVAAASCVVALAGCAVVPPPLPAGPAGPYKLDAGDTVRVIVYNQLSLSTDYMVGDDGMISVPTVGEIKAATRTVQELQQDIYNKLNNGILVNPGVSVQLSQSRPIFVIGEVNKPGQYSYQPKLSVLAAVAVAGGYTVRANHKYVSVMRATQDGSGEWSAGPLVSLQPGDIIVVHEQFF
jgi:polysaccharide export outer membrane protein